MIAIEQLEAEAASEEAALQQELDRVLALWRELSTRLKALKGQLEQAASSGLDVKALGPRVAALVLPQLQPGPPVQRAEALRREAAQARRAAVADLKLQLPDFSAALSRLQYKISAEEGAVAHQVDLARAVAAQVSQAAKQLEAAGDEPMPIGRMKMKRQQTRVRMQVKIDFTSENNFYSGFSTNLSDGGVFVATVKLVPIGTQMDLFFRLPSGDGIEAHGVVRWVREVSDTQPENMPGLGVQFVNLSEAAKAAITAFVREREPMFFPD
jgi:uncharacterized protein (TIGR02266 family)